MPISSVDVFIHTPNHATLFLMFTSNSYRKRRHKRLLQDVVNFATLKYFDIDVMCILIHTHKKSFGTEMTKSDRNDVFIFGPKILSVQNKYIYIRFSFWFIWSSFSITNLLNTCKYTRTKAHAHIINAHIREERSTFENSWGGKLNDISIF